MSGEQPPLPAGGTGGLLRGSRTRSYGSLVRSPLSPVRERRIEHKIQPGETLQGLALKYGVTMEQIKRANRLYTNESIFLKKSLSIPVLSDLNHCNNGDDSVSGDNEGDGASAQNGHSGRSSEQNQEDGKETRSDLTPVDFLKRLDGLINQSKQAAVKGCEEAEKRVSALEAACSSSSSSRTSDQRPLTRSQSAVSSFTAQHQAAHGALPATITRLTKKLRDREDEIFQL